MIKVKMYSGEIIEGNNAKEVIQKIAETSFNAGESITDIEYMRQFNRRLKILKNETLSKNHADFLQGLNENKILTFMSK